MKTTMTTILAMSIMIHIEVSCRKIVMNMYIDPVLLSGAARAELHMPRCVPSIHTCMGLLAAGKLCFCEISRTKYAAVPQCNIMQPRQQSPAYCLRHTEESILCFQGKG